MPLGAPAPGPAAAAAGASPASPGVPGRKAEPVSGPGASPPESPEAERGAELGADEEQPVPYPALAATVFFCLGQTTRPRSWCLRLVCNPYPSRAAGLRRCGTGVQRAGPPPRGPRRGRPRWTRSGMGARGAAGQGRDGRGALRSIPGRGVPGADLARDGRGWERSREAITSLEGSRGRPRGKSCPLGWRSGWECWPLGLRTVRQRRDPRWGGGGRREVE